MLAAIKATERELPALEECLRDWGKLGVIVYTCNPSHSEHDVRLKVQGQTRVHSEYQASLGYDIVRTSKDHGVEGEKFREVKN